MKDGRASLGARTTRATVLFIAFLALLLFACAGTMRYWQGWLYLANFALWTALVGWYVVAHDPALAERRMTAGPAAEKDPAQKRIQAFNSVAMILLYVVSGLDYRFAWSSVPAILVVVGDVLTAIGFIGCLIVFRQNSYASATVGIQTGQTVISDGLYGVVRHPMYGFALFIFAGAPIALGSYWGLILFPCLTAGLIARLRDEERQLRAALPEYADYCAQVQYRLVPFIY